MRIIDMPRGTGKTSTAINLAIQFNYPLVVNDKNYIKYLCEKDNFSFEKLRLFDIQDLIDGNIPNEDIIIDDFDFTIKKIFKHFCHVNPIAGFKSFGLEDLVFFEREVLNEKENQILSS